MAREGAVKGMRYLQLMSSSMGSPEIKIPQQCKGKMALAQWVRKSQKIMGTAKVCGGIGGFAGCEET